MTLERLKGRKHIFVLPVAANFADAVAKRAGLRMRCHTSEVPEELGERWTIGEVCRFAHHPVPERDKLLGKLRGNLVGDLGQCHEVGEGTRIELGQRRSKDVFDHGCEVVGIRFSQTADCDPVLALLHKDSKVLRTVSCAFAVHQPTCRGAGRRVRAARRIDNNQTN